MSRPPSLLRRLAGSLSRHPILCLALLTPGIPEYLSGSSSPAILVVSPPAFALSLAANLGIYTAGVLLIREARVRWGLGWASTLLLGLAYGIAEEGLAVDTLFDPTAHPVTAATAGAFAGVNWVWTSQILLFHAVFSVALPIFLWETALPGLRGRSLLGGRALYATAGIYLGTITAAGLLVARFVYWMGTPQFVGSLLAIAALVLLARRLPGPTIAYRPGLPAAGPRRWFATGFAFFPALLIVPALLLEGGLPLPWDVLVAPAIAGLFLLDLRRGIGTVRSEPGRIAFAAGLIPPVAAFGVIVALGIPIGLPVVVLVDAIAALFLWTLYQRADRGLPVPPSGPPAAHPPTPRFPVETALR